MIIFLNGPPRSGKDTAAWFIQKRLRNCAHYKLSRPLKEGVRCMMQWSHADVANIEMVKDVPLPKLNDYSYRQLQIDFFAFMKEHFGESVLGEVAVRAMKTMIFNHCVISDAGRPAELTPIIDVWKDVGLIELSREGCSFENDIRMYIRPHMEFDNYALIENKWDLEMFELQVERALKKWNLVSQA